jgi:hypothetical protein
VGDEVRDLLCHADFTHFHFAAKRREMLLRAATALAALDAALAEPEQKRVADVESVAALCDSEYAAGMLLGWNLCVNDRSALFIQIRGERMKSAAKTLRTALDAALAEPVHPGYIIGSHWLETAYSRIAAGEAEADVLAEVLGERGWVKPDAKREPATEKQVAEVFKLSGAVYWGHYRNGWREAERFHGIRKEDGK